MKKLQVNDSVEVIDDALSGVIIAIDFDKYTIATSEGVEVQFTERELIKVPDTEHIVVKREELHNVIRSENNISKKRQKSLRAKKMKTPTLEVDLHIEKLVDNPKKMSQFDILETQLQTAKQAIEYAIKKRIKRIIFIHGVGKGVLKTELEYLFSHYSNIDFFDAPYHTYGMGATEVLISEK